MKVRTVTAITSALALGLLYFVFLQRLLVVENWSALTTVELWVFWSMLLRIALVVGLGRKYQIPALVPIILFSIESLLIPPLIIMLAFTGNPAYGTTMSAILTSWIGVCAVLLSPYLIYDFGKYARSDPSLWGIFFLAILEFTYNLFMTTLLSNTTRQINGFIGLGSYFILSLKTYVSSSASQFSTETLLVTGASLIFFVSMLALATLGHELLETNLSLRNVLLVPILAIIVLLLWTVSAVSFTSNMIYVLSVPVFVLAFIVWGGTRGKA